MKPVSIPIVAVGPGSQPPEEESLDFIPMSSDVPTFSMPRIPEDAEAANAASARAVIAALGDAIDAWQCGVADDSHIDVTALAPGPWQIVNEMLGEGEVSIRIAAPRQTRIQETIFAGVWRRLEFDEQGRVAQDRIDIGPIPRPVIDAARRGALAELPSLPPPPSVMNSPALLAEIRQQARARRDGDPAHVVNLTLLPLSPDDHSHLAQSLEPGPVAIISRGFGNCRITSTGVRDVWRVQYFNSMNTLILNTIEVVDVPEVALAAAEDLEDSRARLAELVDWMSESCVE